MSQPSGGGPRLRRPLAVVLYFEGAEDSNPLGPSGDGPFCFREPLKRDRVVREPAEGFPDAVDLGDLYSYVGGGGVGLHLPQAFCTITLVHVSLPPLPPQVSVWPCGVGASTFPALGAFYGGFTVDVVEGVRRRDLAAMGLEFPGDDIYIYIYIYI